MGDFHCDSGRRLVEARNNYKYRMRRAVVRLTALTVLAAVALAVWRFSELGAWNDADRLSLLLGRLNASPWAGPLVVAIFMLATLFVFPVTVLIAATGIALGPSNGFIWASIGSLVAAIATYGMARMLPQHALDYWIGAWIRRMGSRFERGGIVSIMVARNIPIAPFTLINVVAGAAKIPFRDYLIGTMLGMGPTIAALTVLGDRLRDAWQAPNMFNISMLCIAVFAWFILALSLQSLSNRWEATR